MPGNSIAKALDGMPEAFVSDTAISRHVSRAVKAGKLRRLASRLYTRNLTDRPEAVVGRNLWHIAAGYFPGALVADRTGLENAPPMTGPSALVIQAGQNIELPGHTLCPGAGSPRLRPIGPASLACS